MSRTKNKLIGVLTGLMVLCFFQSAHADLGSAAKVKESLAIQSAIKTDSAGSYVHGEKKAEGSKAKAYAHPHKKPEGSSNKSHLDGKSHHKGKKGTGYSKHSGHNKQHYAKSSHKSHAGHKAHSGPSAHSSKCFFSHLLSFKDKLKLSDAQVGSIEKMRFDYRKASILLTADKEVAKMEFDRLVHGKTVDESAIRASGEKIIAVKTKKIRAKVEAKISVMKLLTDEQRTQVHKMHSSH
ncbi:MAG: Spy/CpxP family protein refolding chaperone [Nitrospinales bacterium]|jgi:Spy/CpxP family protein refolding chaperone